MNRFAERRKIEKMAKYRCTICGYIYDPAEGDSTQGVNPGTAFENLPDGWICPVCGAPKNDFVKE
jgi:rubredoxin